MTTTAELSRRDPGSWEPDDSDRLPGSRHYAHLLDLVARDHLTRADQLRRMAVSCSPSLGPLEVAMRRRASECEVVGSGIQQLAAVHRRTAGQQSQRRLLALM